MMSVTCGYNVPAHSLVRLSQRFYSSESTPKITTHYTIVPRESDQRWKGKILSVS